MGKIEELLIRKKSQEEIALFLGVSVSLISQYMTRATPRRILNECSTFKELLRNNIDSDSYTVKDMDYVRENKPEYFRELLRNDYVNNDTTQVMSSESVLKESKIDNVINNIKSKQSVNPLKKKNDIMRFRKTDKSLIYQRNRYLVDGSWRLKKNNREFTYYNNINKEI